MQQRRAGGNRFGVLGIGVAACAACCAGPILTLLGGLSLAGLASTLVVGVAIVAGRRRRPACDDNAGDSVPVTAPTRRAAIAANVSEQTP